MMKRSRPKQHVRRYKSGKRVLVNKGVSPKKKKSMRSHYITSSGTFKEMSNPDKPSSGKKSKFYGCERAQRSKGVSKEGSKKLCGYIAAKKKGYGRFAKK